MRLVSFRKPKIDNRAAPALFLFLALLAFWGCGPAAPRPVVVFCSPNSPRLQQVLTGLRQKLPEVHLKVVCVPQFGEELETGLRQAQKLKPRLLVVLGTPALMQTASLEKNLPVVFALVANPYFTGAADRPDHPEEHQENLTGLTSPPPLEAALQQGAGLLGHRPWGLLYDPNDGVAATLAQEFSRLGPKFGLKPLLAVSTDAAGDRLALQGLYDQGVRVVLLPPAASAARYAPLLLDWGRRKKIMVVSSYPEGSHQGAILWVALDYQKIGEAAAALARRVLGGEAPKKIPLAVASPLKVEVNDQLMRYWSGYPAKLSD